MTRDQRLSALATLGEYILEMDERLGAHVHRSMHTNPWFTKDNQEFALKQIAERFLDLEKLHNWLEGIADPSKPRSVGVVAAGNIPMVAFHDVLTSFVL